MERKKPVKTKKTQIKTEVTSDSFRKGMGSKPESQKPEISPRRSPRSTASLQRFSLFP